MKVSIVNQSGQAVQQAFVRSWVRSFSKIAAREVGAKLGRDRELVIAFLGESAARSLNKQFRSRDYATDVLSFPSDSDDLLGELVICPQVISRQAREHGLLVREELGYMILHGILHLLGYDHEGTQREAKKMFELQDRLFEKLLRSK